MVDIPEEITRIETPITAFPLTPGGWLKLKRLGQIAGGIFLVLVLALGVNWAMSHIGSQNKYNNQSFMGR